MCLLMFEHRIAISAPSWWSLGLHCNLHCVFFARTTRSSPESAAGFFHAGRLKDLCGMELSACHWLEWCFLQCPRSVKMVVAILEAEDRNLLNLEQVCSSQLYANNSHKRKHIVILHLCPPTVVLPPNISAVSGDMEMGKPLQSGVPKWRLLLYIPISSNQIVYYSYIL